MIHIDGISKEYDGFYAVKNCSLTIKKGSFLGLIGPNGAGKSTLIKMLTQIVEPTEGKIYFNGAPVDEAPLEWKQKIGVVPEGLALFEHLSFEENLTFIGALYKLPEKEIHRRCESLLDFFNLTEFRDLPAAQGSTGMRKKLTLAAALIHKPEILFLDEAFTGIDPISVSEIKNLLKKLSASGTTIFVTSHILETLDSLIDSAAIINKGHLLCHYAKDKIVAEHKSLEALYLHLIQEGTDKKETPSWLC